MNGINLSRFWDEFAENPSFQVALGNALVRATLLPWPIVFLSDYLWSLGVDGAFYNSLEMSANADSNAVNAAQATLKVMPFGTGIFLLFHQPEEFTTPGLWGEHPIGVFTEYMHLAVI